MVKCKECGENCKNGHVHQTKGGLQSVDTPPEAVKPNLEKKSKSSIAKDENTDSVPATANPVRPKSSKKDKSSNGKDNSNDTPPLTVTQVSSTKKEKPSSEKANSTETPPSRVTSVRHTSSRKGKSLGSKDNSTETPSLTVTSVSPTSSKKEKPSSEKANSTETPPSRVTSVRPTSSRKGKSLSSKDNSTETPPGTVNQVKPTSSKKDQSSSEKDNSTETPTLTATSERSTSAKKDKSLSANDKTKIPPSTTKDKSEVTKSKSKDTSLETDKSVESTKFKKDEVRKVKSKDTTQKKADSTQHPSVKGEKSEVTKSISKDISPETVNPVETTKSKKDKSVATKVKSKDTAISKETTSVTVNSEEPTSTKKDKSSSTKNKSKDTAPVEPSKEKNDKSSGEDKRKKTKDDAIPVTPDLKELLDKDDSESSPDVNRLCIRQSQENVIGKKESSVAAIEMEKLLKFFMEGLKEASPNLDWKSFNSGSYYDKTKNGQADEFDVMIYPSKLQVVVQFDSAKSTPGFYKVKLETPRVGENIRNMLTDENYIKPEMFKNHVFSLFDEVFSSTKRREFRLVKKKTRSDNSSPAYTIIYSSIPGHPLDIDLVPCFRLSGWPCIARKINPKWLSNDEVVNKSIKYYDVVCKTCPEDVAEKELLWRLSFSYTEKILITAANDGSRFSNKKKIFRNIKDYIQKIKDSNPEKVKKFCSYHIKQFMLNWYDRWYEAPGENAKVQRILTEYLIQRLQESPPFIENYFIENDNVIKYVPKIEIDIIVKGLMEEVKKLSK